MTSTSTLFATLKIMYILLSTTSTEIQSKGHNEECDVSGFCEEVENYPTEIVEKLIEKLISENTLFNHDLDEDLQNEDDFESHETKEEDSDDSFYTQVFRTRKISYPNRKESNIPFGRKNLHPSFVYQEKIELCAYERKIAYPRKADDINGNSRYIINNNKEQGFFIEKCKNYNSDSLYERNLDTETCNELEFLPGYRGECIQKTVLREMIYLDEKTNKSGTEYFVVPVCCSCSVVKIN